MTETTLFMENFYILDDGRVRQFLIAEEKHPYLPCYSYKGKWTEFYYDNEV